jgi:hypothetical protein
LSEAGLKSLYDVSKVSISNIEVKASKEIRVCLDYSTHPYTIKIVSGIDITGSRFLLLTSIIKSAKLIEFSSLGNGKGAQFTIETDFFGARETFPINRTFEQLKTIFQSLWPDSARSQIVTDAALLYKQWLPAHPDLKPLATDTPSLVAVSDA